MSRFQDDRKSITYQETSVVAIFTLISELYMGFTYLVYIMLYVDKRILLLKFHSQKKNGFMEIS